LSRVNANCRLSISERNTNTFIYVTSRHAPPGARAVRHDHLPIGTPRHRRSDEKLLRPCRERSNVKTARTTARIVAWSSTVSFRVKSESSAAQDVYRGARITNVSCATRGSSPPRHRREPRCRPRNRAAAYHPAHTAASTCAGACWITRR
jgi:hypothetical protein